MFHGCVILTFRAIQYSMWFQVAYKTSDYPREARNIIPFFNEKKKNEAQNNCNLSKETSSIIKAC